MAFSGNTALLAGGSSTAAALAGGSSTALLSGGSSSAAALTGGSSTPALAGGSSTAALLAGGFGFVGHESARAGFTRKGTHRHTALAGGSRRRAASPGRRSRSRSGGRRRRSSPSPKRARGGAGALAGGSGSGSGMLCMDPSEAALLIIDPQNDFCEGGALAVPHASAIFPEIAKLQRMGFAHTIVTQDWHPRGHASFASTHGVAPFTLRRLQLDATTSVEQMMWPDHCVQESEGAELHPALHLHAGTQLIRKGTHMKVDSYSGFGDGVTPEGQPKVYEDTGLLAELRERGVRAVVVCGLATDYCVQFTALDAAAYGFRVAVVESACRGVAPESTAAALLALTRKGVALVSSPEALCVEAH